MRERWTRHFPCEVIILYQMLEQYLGVFPPVAFYSPKCHLPPAILPSRPNREAQIVESAEGRGDLGKGCHLLLHRERIKPSIVPRLLVWNFNFNLNPNLSSLPQLHSHFFPLSLSYIHTSSSLYLPPKKSARGALATSSCTTSQPASLSTFPLFSA